MSAIGDKPQTFEEILFDLAMRARRSPMKAIGIPAAVLGGLAGLNELSYGLSHKSAQASPGMMEQVGQRKPVAGRPQKSVAATPTLPAIKGPAPTGRLAQIGAMTQVPKTGKLTAA